MKCAPYGTWKSTISADSVASSAHRLSQLKAHAGKLYWIEQFPERSGWQGIQSYHNHEVDLLTSAENLVRTRVHEYGGGDFCVFGDTLYFVNDKDQRIYRQPLSQLPTPITPESNSLTSYRYADLLVSPNQQYLVCVRETHHLDNPHDVVNDLVVVPTNGSMQVRVIAGNDDFYAFPRISADGLQLAWVSWSHPQMPWDGTMLWCASIRDDFKLENVEKIAGGDTESIYQPEWDKNGILYYVSDRTGWWNIYYLSDQQHYAVLSIEAEFGYPLWILGTNCYTLLNNGDVAAIMTSQGKQQLGVIRKKKWIASALPYDSISPYIVSDGTELFVSAADALTLPCIVSYDLKSSHHRAIYVSEHQVVDKKYISKPQSISFPVQNKHKVYAFYYPPYNEDYENNKDERPPLLVICHGGPTGATSTALNLKIQYWTSRGFAVVDVNYRGSTGYGRSYREALSGKWGIVDVADCVGAAEYLVAKQVVDSKRLAIRGSSAGGYTVLCALTFYNVFSAGASYYGVADLLGLVHDTHKFESRYLDKLIGPLPREKQRYLDRSPLNNSERLSCPIIFFQGLEDKVVPSVQAEKMVAALNLKKLAYAYVTFPDEQHGFRIAENIKQTLLLELLFYGKIFNFMPADRLPALKIENLD